MATQSSSLLARSAVSLLENHFGSSGMVRTSYAPGRVNLIGEHIDYHDLSVLPIALQRGICVAFRLRADRRVVAISAASSTMTDFSLDEIHDSQRVPGDWGNYLKAAALVACNRFQIRHGIEAAVMADLPVAAGLSSSSALLVAFTLALLSANGISPLIDQLMAVLPEGEQFVGTRGGGMDHAAILASHRGHALHIHFNPFAVSHVPVPEHWRLVVADSRHAAEKSAALVQEYNVRRQAGVDALQTLAFTSFRQVIGGNTLPDFAGLSDKRQLQAFSHVVSESVRVQQAVDALRLADLPSFGKLLTESHLSLRDQLLVSTPTIDSMVNTALSAGAAGARITGAGFGGSMVAVCHRDAAAAVRDSLELHHYQGLSVDEVEKSLFFAVPSSGALELLSE